MKTFLSPRLRPLVLAAFAFAVVTQPSAAQAIDTAMALGALRDAAAACTTDAGRLWGTTICGPIALIERATRLVIANDSIGQRPFLRLGGAFVSSAPSGGFANTSVDWNGRRWATIVLPLPADRFDRVALVLHESFHREQQLLHLDGSDPANNQLDQLEGRRWFRLELRALAAALEAYDSTDAVVALHLRDALLFRAARRVLYPVADTIEPALEMQEGLAEYTGEKLALMLTGEHVPRAARRLHEFESNPTFVRSFAYATGPALGLLLDRFAPQWRSDVAMVRDPARLLAAATRFLPPKKNELIAAARNRAIAYGWDTVAREETARDSLRRPLMADFQRRLVDGPTITLRQDGLARGFNPQTLIGFSMDATIYPTGSFSAEWGSLDVTKNGALVANDFRWLRVQAPSDPVAASARTVRGDGWTLTLNPGWEIRPDPERPGNYAVVRR